MLPKISWNEIQILAFAVSPNFEYISIFFEAINTFLLEIGFFVIHVQILLIDFALPKVEKITSKFCHLKLAKVDSQCDQMSRLFLQYLALYNNELLPNSIESSQSKFTILPIIKYNFKKLPKTCKMLPNWRNFAQIWSHCWLVAGLRRRRRRRRKRLKIRSRYKKKMNCFLI